MSEHATIDTATGKEAPPEISSERVKDIFTKIARRYDLFNSLSSFGIYKKWLKRVAELSGASAKTAMLDLAAGTGDVTFAVAKACHPASIMSTDFTPAMLEVGKERYAAGEADGVPVSFQVVDATDIPFPDESFDLATCAYGIRNIPDRMKALSEAFRVLRPGGRYVVLEFSTPPNPVWRALYHFYLRHIIPLIGGIAAGDRAGFVYLGDSIRAFPPQEEFSSMLREAGFSRVRYENRSGGIVAIHIAEK